jgi:hypothetical protein
MTVAAIDLNPNAVVYARSAVASGFNSDPLAVIRLNIEIGFTAQPLGDDNFSVKFPLLT